MNSRLSFFAVAACCAALTGCDWGGVSDEENWSDAYSWLNFTGTYLLQNAVSVPEADAGAEQTQTVSKEQKDGSAKGSIPAKGTSFGTGLSPIGLGIVPGSVNVSVKSDAQTITYSDNGDGKLNCSFAQGSGSVSYDGGSLSIDTGSVLHSTKSSSVTVSYKYYVEGTLPSAGGKPSNENPIVYLTVNQKGNTFTMKDNNGLVYSGRITGTSCTSDSYQVAGDKTISFEVSAGNAKIVGSFTGTTSAANSVSTVVVSNRRINGTYKNGKNSANFSGTAK